MSDDPELRARIEAQVAARRARKASAPPQSSEADPDAQDVLGEDPAGSRSLSPARPWTRREGDAAPPSTGPVAAGESEGEPESDEDATSAAAAKGLGNGAASGVLQPARPWSTRRSSARDEPPPPVTPSNPDIVLRELAAELTPDEQLRLDRVRDLAGEPDPRADEVSSDPAPDEPAGDGEAGARAEARPYPWERREEVDLDLRGAPTWDPSMYPPEAEGSGQPARRAFRWLFARAPQADREPAPPARYGTESGYEPEAVDELEPESSEPVRQPEPPAAMADEPEPEPAAAAAPSWRRPAGRRFGRRSRAEAPAEADDEPGEQFELPEPDAAFEQPWLRSDALPRPTRDWSSRSGERTSAHFDADLDPTAESTPVAASPPISPDEDLEPDLDFDLEPAAPAPAASYETEPEPEREPEPEPEPVAPPSAPATTAVTAASLPRRRPSPGPLAASRAPRRRPRPGPTAAASIAAAAAALPSVYGARPSASPTAPVPRRPWEVDEPEDPDPAATADGSADGSPDDGDDDGKPKGGSGRLRRLFTRGLIIIAIAAGAALLLRTWVVQPYYIPSASMEPTLHGCENCNDDHVLVDKVSYRAHGVRVQDIVVFTRPKGVQVPESVLIKRVIALAGDKITAKKGQIYVNGLAINEPYLNKDKSCYARSPDENFRSRTVPAGSVFVMGDNRCNSTDSRDFGAIPTSSIVGRAFAIIWPLTRIGGL